MRKPPAAALLAGALFAFAARAQQPTPNPPQPAPSPASEHVVAPSLPDQPNKEGVVQPSGSISTDAAGWVTTKQGPIDPTAPTPVPSGGTGAPAASGTGAVPPPQAQGPRGPAVVRAAFLSVSGTVTFFRKGVSITILEKSGFRRTVPLTAGTAAYGGLSVGDRVVARIPLGKPADGKTADRIERQKPPAAPMKSKFEKAESPSN